MYHCHLQFYFIGLQHQLFEPIRQIPPLEAFTYTFLASSQPDAGLARQADVIFADLLGLNSVETVQMLSSCKKAEADLILLAKQPQMELLLEHGLLDSQVSDVWTLPMSEASLRFRFLKWQQNCKRRADAWQTSHFLEAVLDGTPDLVWFKNKDGIHEKVNNSFCKAVNKSKQQIEGRKHAYIWGVEQDDPVYVELDRIAMEKQETCVSEKAIQYGDEIMTLTTYKSPLFDLDGTVMGTVSVAIDVTRERMYAQEFIEKNKTLEALFSTMDCGLIFHTLDGSRITSINQAALHILGYSSKQELLEAGFQLIAPSVFPADRTSLLEGMCSLKNEGDMVTVGYRVQHPNGEIIHVVGNIKLVRERGKLLYQRYLLDCTAFKLKEEQKRQEGERQQMELIHALSIEYNLVCFFDLETGRGRALRVCACKNNILERIFSGALVLEKCIGQYIEACVHEEDQELLRQSISRERLDQVLAEKTIFHLNYRTICCGEVRYFQMKAVRAGKWSHGHGIVLGFRSVDEETRDEREKKAMLEDALSQANRANHAKSIFLSNMSHDIRTPMNAIIGFTTLAITHIDQNTLVEEYLKKIMSSGNHLLSLINDILDMSRIESGKIRLEEQPCSLPDILHGLRNIIQADIHSKQLELFMDAVDIQNEDICCDRLRLNQVLLNLLSNAVKYTGAGGMVSMKVIEKAGAPEGYANYEFRIKDNGIGMDPKFVSHIFEPFERERNSTISGIQGTGLGMAITKNIVDMMHGTIRVDSTKGVGTECVVNFTFRLHSGAKEPQIIPELQGLRALVVDDDFNTCDSVSSMLQQIGLRAEWTMSGKEAVLRTRQAVMHEDPYQVYIIDWLLPDRNGVEVARCVRQEMGQETPVIVLTAYDWSDIETEAREAGVSVFCSKPLFLSELRSCLHEMVHQDSPPEKDSEPILRTGRILLADDNELNREIATAILEEAGFRIETAENGQIVLDKLQAAGPGYYQLILMDVQMPVMGGYDATRCIRKLDDPALASIPILAMTANAFEEDKQAALSCGMDGHIAKPIDIQKLMDTLDTVLPQ